MKTAGALFCLAFFLTAFGTARGDTACQDRPMARGLLPLAYAAEADASIQYCAFHRTLCCGGDALLRVS